MISVPESVRVFDTESSYGERTLPVHVVLALHVVRFPACAYDVDEMTNAHYIARVSQALARLDQALRTACARRILECENLVDVTLDSIEEDALAFNGCYQ